MIKKWNPETAIILGGSHVEINYANFFDSKADYLYHLSGLENQRRLVKYIGQLKEDKNSLPAKATAERIRIEDIPGVCYKKDGEWVVNPKVYETPEDLPVPDRTHFYKTKTGSAICASAR